MRFQVAAIRHSWLVPAENVDRDGFRRTLWQMHNQLARIYAELGETANAVDTACAALLIERSWDVNGEESKWLIESVFVDSRDLDAYVGALDRQAAALKQDNPLVRKMIGLKYLLRDELEKAARQLELAVLLQPDDRDAQQALCDCYWRQGRNDKAAKQMLQLAQLRRYDLELYEKLAQYYTGQPEHVERAYTSIVEVLPNESEPHAKLAQIRQSQNRWDEAIAHWKRVAAIRALEPTGLLQLARAQIHQQHWSAARSTLDQLEARSWPTRFGNVSAEVKTLRASIPEQ